MDWYWIFMQEILVSMIKSFSYYDSTKKIFFFHFVIGLRELWKNLFFEHFFLNFVHYTESEAWFFINYTNHHRDSITSHVLAHWSLVMPYGNINLGQHGSDNGSLQAPNHCRTNISFSFVRICSIHRRETLQCLSKLLFCILKIILLQQVPHRPGPNDLTHWGWVTHLCISKLTMIGSNNRLSPGRRQAII